MSDIAASMQTRHPQKVPYLVIGLYVVAYILLDRISFVAPVAPFAITAWNPPPGLSIAFLVLFGMRYWPALLVSAMLAEIIVRSLPEPAHFAVINTFVMVAGYTALAFMLKRRLQGRANLRTLRDLGWFVGFTIACTLPVAASYVAVLTFAGMLPRMEFLFNTAMFWIGDVIGVIVTTPALLLAWQYATASAMKFRISKEVLLQSAALIITAWIVFGLPYTDEFKFFYLLFIPLIWIAVRDGFVGAVIAIVCIQLALIAWAYLLNEESLTLLELQCLMLALTLAGQFLGMAVTESREALATLREREEELQQALRLASASEMYSAIAHELNQPLAAVSHFAWASRKIAENARLEQKELMEALDNTMAEAHRAGNVTQRLRDLYLGGAVRKEIVNFNLLMKAVIAPLSSRLARHDISLKQNLPDTGLTVYVDPIQINAVVHNVVSNAIESLTNEIVPFEWSQREIVVSAVVNGTMVLVAVDDNGPGIAPEMQDRVFAAFATDKPKGVGLGLAICRSIVEAHGGRIWTEPSRLGGARFCFNLPMGAD